VGSPEVTPNIESKWNFRGNPNLPSLHETVTSTAYMFELTA